MPDSQNPQKTSIEIVKSLLKIGTELQKTANKIGSDYGLNQQQFVVLNEIVRKKEISQKQIIGELLFEKSNVSKMVKKLKKLGFINISGGREDSRVTLLTPTEKGKEVWQECLDKLNDWNITWLQAFNRDELDNTYQVLKRLEQLLYKEMNYE